MFLASPNDDDDDDDDDDDEKHDGRAAIPPPPPLTCPRLSQRHLPSDATLTLLYFSVFF